MGRPKKVRLPETQVLLEDLKTVNNVKQQLSTYEKLKQFFKQFNLF